MSEAPTVFDAALAAVKSSALYKSLNSETALIHILDVAYAPWTGTACQKLATDLQTLTAAATAFGTVYSLEDDPGTWLTPLHDVLRGAFSQRGCFGRVQARARVADPTYSLLRSAVKTYHKTARTTVAFDNESGMWQVTPSSATAATPTDTSYYKAAKSALGFLESGPSTEAHLQSLAAKIDREVAALKLACPKAIPALEALLDAWAETVQVEVAAAVVGTRALAFGETFQQKVKDGALVGATVVDSKATQESGSSTDATGSGVSVLHSGDPLFTALLNVVKGRVSPPFTDEEITSTTLAHDAGLPFRTDVAARLAKLGFRVSRE